MLSKMGTCYVYDRMFRCKWPTLSFAGPADKVLSFEDAGGGGSTGVGDGSRVGERSSGVRKADWARAAFIDGERGGFRVFDSLQRIL